MTVSQQSNDNQEEDDEDPEDDLDLPVPEDGPPVAPVVSVPGPGAAAQTPEDTW